MRGPRPVIRPVKRPVSNQEKPAETQTPVTPVAATPVQEEVKPVETFQSVNTPAEVQAESSVASPSASTVQPQARPEVKKEEAKTAKQSKPVKQPKPVKEKTPGSGARTAVVFLSITVVALVGVIGYLLFERYNQGEVIVAKEQENIEFKSDLERKLYEINKLQDSLKVVIAEKQALGQELNEERAKLAELDQLKEQLKNNQVSIKSLNSKLAKYKNEVQAVTASIATISTEKNQIAAEVEKLQAMVKAKDDSIATLAAIQAKLNEKVNSASALKAENMEISIFTTAGKEIKTGTHKAMTTSKVTILFNLADNKIAEQGQKDIYMRFIEPGGATLYEGDKVFMINGKKMTYTEKKTITFDNSKQKVGFVYASGSRYKPGKYTIEFYCEDKKIGTGDFTLVK